MIFAMSVLTSNVMKESSTRVTNREGVAYAG